MTEFVFANFFKILKRYTNQTISNLEFAYFLFEKVNKDMDDKKTELRINKSQVSRILNRTDDVPTRVRKYYCDKKNFYLIDNLFEEFLNERFEEGMEDELADELRNLYTKDLSFDKKARKYLDSYKDDDYSTYFAQIFVEVLKRNNKLCSAPITIFSKGETSINVITDDLLKIAFTDKYIPRKKIIVIPVNTSFDTKVTDPDNLVQCVSPLTLHGKWIKKMEEKGYSESDINDLIQESLRVKYIDETKPFPIGTIAILKNNNTYFYLFAISIFDENAVAHSDLELFQNALDSLISFYNKNGQGYPIYIPLMGTGRSRLHLSNKESYELIKNKFINKINDILGNINIVIYSHGRIDMEELLNGLEN